MALLGSSGSLGSALSPSVLCLAFRAAFWSVIALMGLLQTSADKEADKKLLPLLGVQA